MTGRIRTGIGGWTFPPWRGVFYPPGLPHARELAYASEHLTALEINGTFYRHQTPETFAAWRDATPADFVFTVKAHRATTHGKDLAASGPAIERFLASGPAELGTKLGPVLWQLAHTRKFDPVIMDIFLSCLPTRIAGRPLRHAIEARHASFDDPAWPKLAARHQAAIVIVDSDKQILRGDATADFIYARLQRNDAATPEGYATVALDKWAARFQAWSHGKRVSDLATIDPAPPKKSPKRDCFVFFISGDKQRAPEAATALMKRLGQE